MDIVSKRPDPTHVGTTGKVIEVPASEVKNAWHEFVDRVSGARQEIVVTRYGKPVMKLSPIGPAGGPAGDLRMARRDGDNARRHCRPYGRRVGGGCLKIRPAQSCSILMGGCGSSRAIDGNSPRRPFMKSRRRVCGEPFSFPRSRDGKWRCWRRKGGPACPDPSRIGSEPHSVRQVASSSH